MVAELEILLKEVDEELTEPEEQQELSTKLENVVMQEIDHEDDDQARPGSSQCTDQREENFDSGENIGK